MGDKTGAEKLNSYQAIKVPSISEEQRNAIQDKVKDLKSSLADRAQTIINDLMPAKILQLDDLFLSATPDNLRTGKAPTCIDTSFFSYKDLQEVRPTGDEDTSLAPATKKRKVDESNANDDSELPNNNVVEGLLRILKMEILQLIEYCNTVKIWIQLNIPRIEDGNNFGVSIQEETVNELSRAEDSGFTVLESITKYYVMRGKLVSKVHKYPTIRDYRMSIQELDEKEYINLRLCTQDLRNNYAILHDMITKNMEKIKRPRNANNASTMY
eukprot:comp26262_c0_seq1/m.47093 comp26262_c0_seq1/g.47093  ORF comp26262_c0_seq1/g.47093 comp26262_c0_seq1/m.47093 type:complete len:270 (-) comp26262_c0_seq1:60-869(-)